LQKNSHPKHYPDLIKFNEIIIAGPLLNSGLLTPPCARETADSEACKSAAPQMASSNMHDLADNPGDMVRRPYKIPSPVLYVTPITHRLSGYLSITYKPLKHHHDVYRAVESCTAVPHLLFPSHFLRVAALPTGPSTRKSPIAR